MMSLQNGKSILHEDWTTVLLGGIIIAVTLAGFSIPPPDYSWESAGELSRQLFESKNISSIGSQFLAVFAIALAGAFLTGKPIRSLLIVFPFVFVVTLLALMIAGNTLVSELNLEAVIFSLGLGLLIGNVIRLPNWFREALGTEVYVKIGLILLGTGVIFSDILKAGSLGLIQALVVVLTVWYFAFWLCRKLEVDDELAMMISSAVSICGVSAAIATAGAIKGDAKKLSYVISLVLITAIPMMIFMPAIAKYFQFPQQVTGAWLGGSIDTTGAVVASGTLVGETALKISTIVKFSQNVLLGIAAFVISLYWSYRKKPEAGIGNRTPLSTIWERFPKFVLGFMAASVLFSFFIAPETTAAVKGSLKSLQNLWFALAFTSIGLETRFGDLFNKESKRPLYAFLIAQGFNIAVTLIMAFVLFG